MASMTVIKIIIIKIQEMGLIWGIKTFIFNFDINMFLKLKFYISFILLINCFGDLNCAKIGINEWFIPQISEHCPVYNPIRFENKKIWFSRPGRASTFVPIDGIVQEWITSADVIKDRIKTPTGRCSISLVFKSRRVLESSMKFSVSFLVKEVYS